MRPRIPGLIPFFLAAGSAATAAVPCVAPGGSDSNPGTEAQPWRTPAKAAAAVPPGDTVRISPGSSFSVNHLRAGLAAIASRPDEWDDAWRGPWSAALRSRDLPLGQLALQAIGAHRKQDFGLALWEVAGDAPRPTAFRVAALQIASGDNKALPAKLQSFFAPPAEFAGQFGSYASPLKFHDGRPVAAPAEWPARRAEILKGTVVSGVRPEDRAETRPRQARQSAHRRLQDDLRERTRPARAARTNGAAAVPRLRRRGGFPRPLGRAQPRGRGESLPRPQASGGDDQSPESFAERGVE